eukprot:7355049-Prymnesium_polylepis.1
MTIKRVECQKLTGRSECAMLSPLYAELFPNAPPVALQALPACAQQLKVYVYDHLQINASKVSRDVDVEQRAATTADVVNEVERRRGRANCDWARSPCRETTTSRTGGNWDYSNQRQYAAEMPLLAKLLLMAARRPTTADEADLYVVPWLGSTELSWWFRHWSPSSAFVNSRFRSVVQQVRTRLVSNGTPKSLAGSRRAPPTRGAVCPVPLARQLHHYQGRERRH